MRGLQEIFSPLTVLNLNDSQIQAIAMEPSSARRQRDFLKDRIKKLEEGQIIFHSVLGLTAS